MSGSVRNSAYTLANLVCHFLFPFLILFHILFFWASRLSFCVDMSGAYIVWFFVFIKYVNFQECLHPTKVISED